MDPQPMKKVEKKGVKILTGIPEAYLTNKALNQAIGILPSHYSFEIPKTIHRIDTLKKDLNKEVLNVSLQFPEGLMLFGCVICDIIKTFTNANTIILGDVTYGACCVDDIASNQLDCDLLVHYGHSCLVPITETKRKVLYIFVEIHIDIQHFIDTIVFNFPDTQQTYYLMGTIQFNSALFQAKNELTEKGYHRVVIPQEKPRSSGEILGCTSPVLPAEGQTNIVIFLCDGRFHMEATMIANPSFTFYQYDPYTRNLTEEKYANNLMIQRRTEELLRAKNGEHNSLCFILGTLGRQGNPAILQRLIAKVKGKFDYMILLASEINVELLTSVDVDFFVQIACPRLSIDWSYGTPKPLLTPFELFALIDEIDLKKQYSMDYYSHNGGPWSNFYGKAPIKKCKGKEKPKVPLVIQN